MQEAEKKKKGIFKPSIMEHRKILANATPEILAESEITYVDMLVPINDTTKIPVVIYMPKDVDSNDIPTIFYLTGTGFVANEIPFTHMNCTHISRIAQARIIVIYSRLAPENQFPVGYTDAYQVFKYFLDKSFYPIGKNKIGILGYSSGGNFAALMTIQARLEGIEIAKQILISPLVDLSRTSSIYQAIEQQDTDISEPFVNWSVNHYLSPKEDRKNPNISPFWQKNAVLAKLPATDIITSESDRCFGDAVNYYKKLLKAKIMVDLIIIPNTNHTFFWRNIEVIEAVGKRFKAVFNACYKVSDNKQAKL